MKYLSILILIGLNPTYAERPIENKHNEEKIFVFGHRDQSNLLDFVPSVTNISGEELLIKRETSLGDTLMRETGVNSTTFGPNAGRPVIRGLDGDRVKVLQNGLGTLDASTQSVDHALSIDTLTIDQIEIVRGPMSLLYGSSAVGGVVNIVTNRIHRDFDKGFYAKFNADIQSAQPGASQSLVLNYGVDNWMIHADGSFRNLGELKTPKFEIENSFNKQRSGGFGVSKILTKGHLGFSYSHLDNLYGTVAEPDVTIDLQQNRYELHFEYDIDSGFFDHITIKSTQADYKHIEFEGPNEGTVFTNKGNETRLELGNAEGYLTGTTGIHSKYSDFKADGEEAFLPQSETLMLSLFTLQSLEINDHTWSLGLRYEKEKIEKEASTTFGSSSQNDFDNFNISFGHQYRFTTALSLNQSLSLTSRAPTAQELFANGAHMASSTFEVGNQSMEAEKAVAYEINMKRKRGKSTLSIASFYQRFDGHITLLPTGSIDSESSFPIFNYYQRDATFYGFEAQFLEPIAMTDSFFTAIKGSFDYVRASRDDTNENLARITPMRLSTGLQLSQNRWQTDVDLRYSFKQNKVAPNETKTPDFFLVDLSFHYDFLWEKVGLTLYTKVNNIFDKLAINHTSLIKNQSPLPGRNYVLGVQGSF